ncbi:MAG: universal stress protein [Deltaproteobacteria bacterium]|nr:universal stress protein [Deltaproteobacteria bacterium]MBW2129739.1 universal stress protein [Deltaproteobacteria bacterium]MBW2304342.1 universal stress protein [Deltaproteobacteria bacterium]
MFQRTLVVFENEKVCTEALRYARELALRMDAEVTFLMLVEMTFPQRAFLDVKRNSLHRLEDRVSKTMSDFAAQFLHDGIPVSVALRVGDPTQEFLKFLAEKPPFQAVIWGSGEDLPESGGSQRTHWLKKLAGTLECSLLTVSRRRRGPDYRKGRRPK